MTMLFDDKVDWNGAVCYDGKRKDGTYRVDSRLFDYAPAEGRVERHEIAATYCERCPIRDDCLAYGITNRMSGTWGGLFLDGGHIIPPPLLGQPAHKEKEEVSK